MVLNERTIRMKSKYYGKMAAGVLNAFAAAAVICSAVLFCGAREKKIKTVLMSADRYAEMAKSIEEEGRYVFWDYEIALVVTNSLKQAEPPPVFIPAPGAHENNKRRRSVNSGVWKEPQPYFLQNL